MAGICEGGNEPTGSLKASNLAGSLVSGPGMRAAPFSRPELLSLRKALQFQARAERSRSGGLALQLPSLH
ncbi:hypothetical protein ANN_00433 [Periplaneta americana]|uniref:Uncharacterized protein n=1 Tax=Periplaneta americana TaxID=6978 RepID=A0ABQ8TR00_PERAM|nr:hypothetical protein ANN_00433 [Periplaneta americana]